MRLTLRTLLAYLDDTLTPAETKQIGQKVAESDTAQELIARIKQVTRRRRLASPPVAGPGAKWDANLVALYLDNGLSPEEVADVEKQCLESDTHLAEVAGVHQILTLAQGEQALVPPTAMQRMYGLVRGREAVRGRKAPPPAATRRSQQEVLMDGAGPVDDPLLMGLPQYRRSSWLQWALPAAALVILVGLVAAIWAVMHNFGAEESTLAGRGTERGPAGDHSSVRVEESKTETAHLAPVSQVQVAQGFAEFLDKASAATPSSTGSGNTGPGTPGSTPEPDKTATWFDTPSTKRTAVGRVGDAPRGLPFLLVSRQAGASGEMWEGWDRAAPASRVFSSDSLVAPPGCRAEVQLDKRVDVYLWGNVPQFLSHLPLNDSSVTINPSDRYDLDLTLHRGRIILTNRKESGAAKVRLRFYQEEDKKVPRDGKEEIVPGRKEIWDITLLEPETEIGLERVSMYTSDIAYGSGIGPQCELYLVVLKGKASVNVDEFHSWNNLQAPPGPALIEWNNIGMGTQQPRQVRKEALEFWNKALPTTQRAKVMHDALDDLLRNVNEKKTKPDVAAHQAIDGPQPAEQILGVYMLGSLDDLAGLMDALADPRDDHAAVRNIAVVTLRFWIGRNDANDRILADALMKKRYSKKEARTILELLHGIPEQDQRLPHVWEDLISYLKSPKVEIRQLAELKLAELVPQGRHIPFNPAGDTTQIEAAYRAWKEIIPDGKLPPPPPQPGAGGAPPPGPTPPQPPKGP